MSPEFRKQIRTIVLIGLAAFVVINGCSWQPGYGGRNDRKPGMEVERYFGWPACFYADLWRSDEPLEVEPWSFAPPMPMTSKMYFVYSSFGVVPLLLDAGFVLAGIVAVTIVSAAEHRGTMRPWMTVFCWVLVLVAIAIVKFGDMTSVFL